MESRLVYGSPRIHQALVKSGIRVGINTVAKLMKNNGIQSKVTRRFKSTTQSRHNRKVADNLLNREFAATSVNKKWVSDVTCVPTGEGWLYLATVLDLYSRMIVGWAMGNRNNTELAMAALDMAIHRRGKPRGVLVHSDRGA
jgi:transposase InsO family protein